MVGEELEREEVARGSADDFAKLKPKVLGRGSADYATLAQELDVSESALRVRVHRLRKRFGILLRKEVSETVAVHDDVDLEIRHLFTILEG